MIRLGGAEQTRQAYRDRRTLPWIEELLQDLRFGLRMMARNRGFTVVAVLTLAIGIGATATAFTWIDAVLLQPLSGVKEPNRLVTVETVTSNGEWVPNSYPDFIDFRDRLKLFDGVAVTHVSAFSVGKENHAERVWGELVSGNFFAVLGVKAEAGRMFLPAEFGDVPGAYPVAVISDRYWRSHYGADPSVIGRTIRINQHELTIVGVAAPAVSRIDSRDFVRHLGAVHGAVGAEWRAIVDAARPARSEHAGHRAAEAGRELSSRLGSN